MTLTARVSLLDHDRDRNRDIDLPARRRGLLLFYRRFSALYSLFHIVMSCFLRRCGVLQDWNCFQGEFRSRFRDKNNSLLYYIDNIVLYSSVLDEYVLLFVRKRDSEYRYEIGSQKMNYRGNVVRWV